MAICNVVEHARLHRDAGKEFMPVAGNVVVYQADLDFSGGAATTSAFGTATRLVWLCADAVIRYKVSGTPTGTDGIRLPANTPHYVGVDGGDTITVIASAA